MAHSPQGSRIVYSSLPETLTEDDLARLSTVNSEEWAWARGVARRGPSMVRQQGVNHPSIGAPTESCAPSCAIIARAQPDCGV